MTAIPTSDLLSTDLVTTRNDLEKSSQLDLVDIYQNPGLVKPNPNRNDQITHQRNIRLLKARGVVIQPEIPNPSTANEPRPLNNAEIHYILTGIPVPSKLTQEFKDQIPNYSTSPKCVYSSDPYISFNIYQQLYNTYAQILEEIVLTPSAVEDYKTNLTQYWNISRAVPYTTVGLLASDAIGAQTIQTTLNSFANILGNTVSYSLDYMKELLDASSKRKQLMMTLHFKDKHLTFEDILGYRNQLPQVSVGDLVYDYDIEPVEDLQTAPWYQYWSQLEEFKLSTYGLRLKLDLNKMYSYQIDMELLVTSILSKGTTTEGPALVNIVPSPLNEGIIDIYPVESRIYEGLKRMEDTLNVTNSNSSIIFLNNIILRDLDKMIIKGVERISDLIAIETNIWSLIISENMVTNIDFNLVLNYNTMAITGLNYNRLVELFQFLSFRNIEVRQNRLLVTLPSSAEQKMRPDQIIPAEVLALISSMRKTGSSVSPYTYLFEAKDPDLLSRELKKLKFEEIKTNKTSVSANIPSSERIVPSSYIFKLVSEDDDKSKELYARQKQEFIDGKRKLIKFPITALNQIYTYVYAQTVGSNLADALTLEYLDSDLITTNDIHETANILGIEAARNILIKELIDTLSSNSSYIDPKHVILAADYLTNTGGYLGFTTPSLAKQDISGLDRTSFQRSFDVFNELSAYGTNEKITSATSSIFVGVQGKFGTGAAILQVNNAKRNKYLEEIKETNYAADTLSAAIDNLDITGNGGDRNDLDILEMIESNGGEVKEASIPSYSEPIQSLTPNNIDRGIVHLNSNGTKSFGSSLPLHAGEYKGNGVSTKISSAPAPIISNLVKQSIQKIPGIPTLNIPEPIKLPIPNGDLSLPNGTSTYNLPRNQVLVEDNNGSLAGVRVNGLTESKNSAIPIAQNGAKIRLGTKKNTRITVAPIVPTIPVVPTGVVNNSAIGNGIVIPGVPTSVPTGIPRSLGIPIGIPNLGIPGNLGIPQSDIPVVAAVPGVGVQQLSGNVGKVNIASFLE